MHFSLRVKSVILMPSDAQFMNTEQNYSWGNNINALLHIHALCILCGKMVIKNVLGAIGAIINWLLSMYVYGVCDRFMQREGFEGQISQSHHMSPFVFCQHGDI